MSADNVTSPPGRSGPARSRPALIPIVDPNIDPDQIAAQAPTAVRSVGFIVGIGHRLAASADWLRAAVADFVELPLERRLQHLATAANDWLGYAPPASEALAASQGRTRPGDLRQTWTWRPGDPRNPWPHPGADLRSAADAFAAAALELFDARILPVLSLILGGPAGWLADYHGTPEPVCRANHYPPVREQALRGQMRAPAHRGHGPATMVVPDAPGLQVRVDRRWIPVPWAPDTALVNLGSELERLAGDLDLQPVTSTEHRVIPPDHPWLGGDHTSLVCFWKGAPDTLVDVRPGGQPTTSRGGIQAQPARRCADQRRPPADPRPAAAAARRRFHRCP